MYVTSDLGHRAVADVLRMLALGVSGLVFLHVERVFASAERVEGIQDL